VDTLTLKSYAKVNLYLQVLNRRKDGFHNLKTLFERIDLCDSIILKARRDRKIRIISDSAEVPKDETNLCCRAAALLRDRFRPDCGVDITLIKHIPVAAGLGGGSSNAAAVLVGLNRLWKLGISVNTLDRFAAKIGSDAPFFVHDAPFASGSGRGERVKPLSGLTRVRFWHIIVVPRIKVSTPLIYRKWDEFSGLTPPKYNVKILTSALKETTVAGLSRYVYNSLEPVTAGLYQEVGAVKDTLEKYGLKTILMSGSGPAVFGIVPSRKEALLLRSKIRNRSWRTFIARTD